MSERAIKGRTRVVKDDNIGKIYPRDRIDQVIKHGINLRPNVSSSTNRRQNPNPNRQGVSQRPAGGNAPGPSHQQNRSNSPRSVQSSKGQSSNQTRPLTLKERLCECDHNVQEICLRGKEPFCNCKSCDSPSILNVQLPKFSKPPSGAGSNNSDPGTGLGSAFVDVSDFIGGFNPENTLAENTHPSGTTIGYVDVEYEQNPVDINPRLRRNQRSRVKNYKGHSGENDPIRRQVTVESLQNTKLFSLFNKLNPNGHVSSSCCSFCKLAFYILILIVIWLVILTVRQPGKKAAIESFYPSVPPSKILI